MTRMLRVVAAASFALTTAAFAQAPAAPPAGAPPQGQRRPIPNPTNLKVLPSTLTGQEVVAIMRKWEGELGVECEYCHAKDPATGRNNFASDANPIKDRARLMLKMNMSINKDFIAQLDPKAGNDVSCGTCHRGVAKPTVFAPPPRQQQPRPAAPPAGTPPATTPMQ